MNRARTLGQVYSPPHEEGWLRHQENFGEANLNAAAGVVAHKHMFSKRILNLDSVSDHPVRSFKGGFAISSRCRVHPSSWRKGIRAIHSHLLRGTLFQRERERAKTCLSF